MIAVLVACSTTTSFRVHRKARKCSRSGQPVVRKRRCRSRPPHRAPHSYRDRRTVITAELWDNAPARALIDRLPLTLDFSDLNAVEKIARLDPGLPMTGMPDGDDPAPRDIGWYAPSSDVVLYYGDVGYWPGIARIGHISGDIDTIADQQGDFTATIELAT